MVDKFRNMPHLGLSPKLQQCHDDSTRAITPLCRFLLEINACHRATFGQGDRGCALALDHDIEGHVHRNWLFVQCGGLEVELANRVNHALIQHLVD